MKKLNPHLVMNAYVVDGVRQIGKWICPDCGAIGTFGELNNIACTKKHEPCEYCGRTPICAPDCPGILSILNDPKVHIAGDTRDKKKGGEA